MPNQSGLFTLINGLYNLCGVDFQRCKKIILLSLFNEIWVIKFDYTRIIIIKSKIRLKINLNLENGEKEYALGFPLKLIYEFVILLNF
jgi:hypothetical protein